MRSSFEQVTWESGLFRGVTTEEAGRGSSGMPGIIQTRFPQEIVGVGRFSVAESFCLKTDTLRASVWNDIAAVVQFSIGTEHSACFQLFSRNRVDGESDTPSARG